MFSVVVVVLLAIELVKFYIWRVMESSYTAVREVVDLAEILGQGQAGEEGRGC